MQFQKFRFQDFPEYKSWYKDPELNKHLGPPPDQEWLDCVMQEKEGCEYSVFDNNKMVAVLGINFPTAKDPSYYITDIAINPGLKNQGIGSKVLDQLLILHPLKPGQSWKAFLNKDNQEARAFFSKKGWVCESKTPGKNNMLTFSYK